MAAGDILLKIEGVKGESQDANYRGSIELKNWGFSCSTPTDPATKQSTGRMQVSDLTVIKDLDKSSPVLIDACKRNLVFKKVELIIRKAGGEQKEYYRVELKNARIRSVGLKGHPPDGVGVIPEETIGLSFQKISWSYREQNSAGDMQSIASAEFDATTNT